MKGGKVSANIKKFKSDKMLIITKILQGLLNTTTLNIVELIKEYNKATFEIKKKITECSKEALVKDKQS